MTKNNVYGGFAQALFFSGSISIPEFLLDHYSEIGMTDREMMLVIHIISENRSDKPSEGIHERIIHKMGISALDFKNTVLDLQSKGLLKIAGGAKSKKNYISGYDFAGLIDQLFELWGITQFKEIAATNGSENHPPKDLEKSPLPKITSIFEQELGRPLTAFECEHIEKWLLASYSEELIIEALRRGVSAGIRNFRYLDSILREWEKKGLKTRSEIEAEDEHFQTRQGKKTDKKSKKAVDPHKYDDLYL